jgi:hypothetical protein
MIKIIYRAEALLPARHSSPILALQLVLSPARRFFKAFFDFKKSKKSFSIPARTVSHFP